MMAIFLISIQKQKAQGAVSWSHIITKIHLGQIKETFEYLRIFKISPAVSLEQNPNFLPTKSRYGMNRSATASLHSATLKKNVPCNSDMVVVKFFLKKEKTFFFGVLPSRSRAGSGTMRTKFCKNYFLGNEFAKTSADLFLNSDVANGKGEVWGGIFHLLLFLFWRNSGRTSLIQYITTWNITQWNTIILIYDKGNF